MSDSFDSPPLYRRPSIGDSLAECSGGVDPRWRFRVERGASDPPGGVGEEINYRERCQALEVSLVKFKQKAARIRELLDEKMRSTDNEVRDANQRAMLAEEKCKLLEGRCGGPAATFAQLEFNIRVEQLERKLRDRDLSITNLQCELEEQKQLRQQEARLVEEKSTKIREWIATKIHEMETANRLLLFDNESLRKELGSVRVRCPSLVVTRDHDQAQVYCPSSDWSDADPPAPPVPPKRPSSSVLEGFLDDLSTSDDFSSTTQLISTARPSDTPSTIAHLHSEPSEMPSKFLANGYTIGAMNGDYEDLDDIWEAQPLPQSKSVRVNPVQASSGNSSVGIYPVQTDSGTSSAGLDPVQTGSDSPRIGVVRPVKNGSVDVYSGLSSLYQTGSSGVDGSVLRPACAPPLRIERKIFGGDRLPRSLSIVSSSIGSRDPLDDDLGMNDLGMNSSGCSHDDDAVTGSHHASSLIPCGGGGGSVTLTPKEVPSPLTPFLPEVPPNSPLGGGAYGQASQTVSALVTMPRCKKNAVAQRFFPPGGEGVEGREEAGRGYGPLTIDRRYKKCGFEQGGTHRAKPPTPPMRRLPSWEGRIYSMASCGLEILVEAEVDNVPDCKGGVLEEVGVNGAMLDCPTVPVYATLQGRAAQIRSSPFSEGESSSDSSPEQDNHLSKRKPLRSTPIATSNPIPNNSSRSAPTLTDGQIVVSGAAPMDCKRGETDSNLSPTSNGSKRTLVRDASLTSLSSDTSSDYALPPDDAASVRTDVSEICEGPEERGEKLTTESARRNNQEKSGYLLKLGGKVKSWQRRWFVLKNGELFYYRTPNEMSRSKSKGHVVLDPATRVIKINCSLTFEIITPKRTFYLTADSASEADKWVRAVQNALYRRASECHIETSHSKESTCGWLIKTKNGRRRHCWCALVGKTFLYYRSPGDQTPLGQLHLRDARVEEIDRSCDSDSSSSESHGSAGSSHFTLAILPPNDSPTYLLIPVRQTKDSWLYHLTVACGGSAKVGTEYEQLVARLMSVEGDAAAVWWKDPALLYSREPLPRPLTTLSTDELQKKAVELFKSCQSFMGGVVDASAPDRHVTLARALLAQCLAHPELQTELYAQLIKQTSRHPPQSKSSGVQSFLLCGTHSWFHCDASPTSPTSSLTELPPDSKLNPPLHALVQGWQLLTVAIALFLPRQSVLWYLRQHLQRNADSRTDAGKYAVFCQCALERTIQNGPREKCPSRMEVVSILLRNPYHHSQPISIPVHFLNGSYQVVSFDGSTTVQEFVSSLNRAINMRDCALSGFNLYTDHPTNDSVDQCLKPHLKLCDVISKWEQDYSTLCPKDSGHQQLTRTVRLTYKNKLYFKAMSRTETEKERLLLAHQTNEEIVCGRFPVSRSLAAELTAIMAQIEFGDLRSHGETTPLHFGDGDRSVSSAQLLSPASVSQAIERFYPRTYRCKSGDDNRCLEHQVAERWAAMRGKGSVDCVRVYLSVVRQWAFFGYRLFPAKVKQQVMSGEKVWLAVGENSLAVLGYATLKPLAVHSYVGVITFGGCFHDFMVVADSGSVRKDGHRREGRSQRFLYSLPNHLMLELTMLMATYINTKPDQSSGSSSSQLDKHVSISDHHSITLHGTLQQQQHAARTRHSIARCSTSTHSK